MKFTGALYDDDLRTTLPQRTWARHRIRRTLFNHKLTMIKILEYMAGLPVVYDLSKDLEKQMLFKAYETALDLGQKP
jgi:hypothetical protein